LSAYEIERLADHKLRETIICSIDLSREPEAKFTVQVRLRENHGNWKRDWYFEGITVTPDRSRGKDFTTFKSKYLASVAHKPFNEESKEEPKP